jgi:oligopeptide transport system ATP-binding protein
VPILSVENLTVAFNTRQGSVRVVDDVGFHVEQNEVLAIVGESGSGKTVSVLAVLRLLRTPPAEIVAGRANFLGEDLLRADRQTLHRIRGGRIGLVQQDPLVALNPVMTIGRQITETLTLHLGMRRRAALDRAVELLDMVGIPQARQRAGDYPHQFSGGMRQRVMIAIAIACNPVLLIADEPTTALDVTIQAQIVALIQRLRDTLGLSIIWITHDLGIVARLATRVVVMRAGRVEEEADVRALFTAPRSAYTRRLLDAVPRVDRPRRQFRPTLAGSG